MSASRLKSFAIFSALDETDREVVDDLLETLELEAGQPLFQEGAESEGLILVEEGSLRVESARAGRAGTVAAGGVLGTLSLIALGTREVTAVAAEPTRVRLLSRPAFLRLVDDAPRAGCRLLESVLAETAGLMRTQLTKAAAKE